MKIFLLAPNYCWHTEDLLKLSKYSKKLNYIFVSDTPIFFSRRFYEKYFNFINVSYEFWQRLWRLIFCMPWALYLKNKTFWAKISSLSWLIFTFNCPYWRYI